MVLPQKCGRFSRQIHRIDKLTFAIQDQFLHNSPPNRIAISMEIFSVSRNGVWFTRSGSEESSQSRNFCVPRISWEDFHPTYPFLFYTRSINCLKNPLSNCNNSA